MVSSYQTNTVENGYEDNLTDAISYTIKSIEPYMIANDSSKNTLIFNVIVDDKDLNTYRISLRYSYSMETVDEYTDIYNRIDFLDKRLPLNILYLDFLDTLVLDFKNTFLDKTTKKMVIVATSDEDKTYKLLFTYNQHFMSFAFIMNYCSSVHKKMDFMLRNSIINGKAVLNADNMPECEFGNVLRIKKINKIFKVKNKSGHEYHVSLSLITEISDKDEIFGEEELSISIPIDCFVNIKSMKRGSYIYGIPEYNSGDFITTIFAPIYPVNMIHCSYALLAKHIYGESWRSIILYFDSYTIDVIKSIILANSRK